MSIIIIFFFVSLVVATLAIIINKYKHVAACYLWWALFPILFPYYAKRTGVIKHQWKSWLLVLIAPLTLFALLIVVAIYSIGVHCSGIPKSIDYHNAIDLEKATGVEFPDVIPVDSTYEDDFNYFYTEVKFVSIKPLTKTFYKKLDRACIEDSCCWTKEDTYYYYHINPERPLDRTKGTHKRKVEWKNEDGTVTIKDDWDGDYVSVIVPIKGDTIIVQDGWWR